MDINTYLADFTGDKDKVKQFIKRSIALLKFNGQMVDDSFANDLFQWVNKNRSKETLKAFEYFQKYYAEINQSLGQSEGESILVDTPEEIARDKLGNATAIFHENLYILSWQSTSAATDYNNKTYFADVEKWMEWKGISQVQPYWGEFTGFNYQFYTQKLDSGRVKLYGVKGVTTIGSVHETLNNTIHNDNGGAIDAYAVLGWLPISGDSSYKNFKQIY
jgi:hypothetical protein